MISNTTTLQDIYDFVTNYWLLNDGDYYLSTGSVPLRKERHIIDYYFYDYMTIDVMIRLNGGMKNKNKPAKSKRKKPL